ncbi:MAG TPA: hypothetical protein VII40_00335 [Xanthobacteraceae bacterium]|jgi:hypothetical protein
MAKTMLDDNQVQQIARQVATANLSSASFTSVRSISTVDSDGHEALRITIVLKPGVADKIKGDAALDMLVQMQQQLRKAGEERFPFVEFATKQELEAGGNPKS